MDQQPQSGERRPTAMYVSIYRILAALSIVLKESRTMARRAADHGDDGTNDLIVTDVI